MILVLGGTSDSLKIAENLEKNSYDVCFSVVYDYGQQLAEKKVSKVAKGRMDQELMVDFILENKVDLILDGTHPFAAIVSKTAISAAQEAGITYVRYERPEVSLDNIVQVHSVEEACTWVNKNITGTIYLTTGSKTLSTMKANLPLEKLVARVLPTAEVLAEMERLGFLAHQIEAIKGPFSIELNKELLIKNQAKVMITKESGLVGGIVEKVEACHQLDVPCVVISREKIAYPKLFNEAKELYKWLEEQK